MNTYKLLTTTIKFNEYNQVETKSILNKVLLDKKRNKATLIFLCYNKNGKDYNELNFKEFNTHFVIKQGVVNLEYEIENTVTNEIMGDNVDNMTIPYICRVYLNYEDYEPIPEIIQEPIIILVIPAIPIKRGRPRKLIVEPIIPIEPKKRGRKINDNAIYKNPELMKEQRKVINKKTYDNRGGLLQIIKGYKKRYNLDYPTREDYEGKSMEELFILFKTIEPMVLETKLNKATKKIQEIEAIKQKQISILINPFQNIVNKYFKV